MGKARVFSITQTETPPKHNSQWMCDSKMVKLIGPCMDLNWPKEKDFHIILKNDHDRIVVELELEVKMLREQRNVINEGKEVETPFMVQSLSLKRLREQLDEKEKQLEECKKQNAKLALELADAVTALTKAKAVIQRQAELISFLIREQSDLAKIKEKFEANL